MFFVLIVLNQKNLLDLKLDLEYELQNIDINLSYDQIIAFKVRLSDIVVFIPRKIRAFKHNSFTEYSNIQLYVFNL